MEPSPESYSTPPIPGMGLLIEHSMRINSSIDIASLKSRLSEFAPNIIQLPLVFLTRHEAVTSYYTTWQSLDASGFIHQGGVLIIV
jgi:hypothetical protein